MQRKKYNFTLPRHITRKQWRIIHSEMRRKLRQMGGEAVKLLSQKYGMGAIFTVSNHAKISFFWDLASHKQYDRDFFPAAIRGNSQGLTRDRFGGVVLSLNDPKHPAKNLPPLGGDK